jgi:hypothetical protein
MNKDVYIFFTVTVFIYTMQLPQWTFLLTEMIQNSCLVWLPWPATVKRASGHQDKRKRKMLSIKPHAINIIELHETWLMKVKGKVVTVLNKVLLQEDVLEEWRYSSTHSLPRYYIESGQFHDPDALPPGKEPPVPHCIGSWVSPSADLDTVAKKIQILLGIELRSSST